MTVTDGTGQFTFSGLAPGMYDVTFTLSGFTAPAQVVEVSAGATASINVEMEVGGFEELVVVVGACAVCCWQYIRIPSQKRHLRSIYRAAKVVSTILAVI